MADEQGETRRQRNERFEIATPDMDLPDEGLHVWEWFWDLSARRRAGPEALSYSDVGDWQRLLQLDLLPQEVAMLMAMDDKYLAAVREDQAAARERALDAQNGSR
ncbi:hypothetical protein H9654_00745 [Stenotrophomonas sp. Sa5BUN4]|uniref:Uncharacterized protein n=1 Tax=Stenotrophomonas lacuserhaii TaxID=2760084 RepID=A0A8X8K0U7_9GAMM|nr:hypothetical protein [Stenotrophomonas pennii]MBD7952719.1 hypothetical protein [Stenotrophomonas pennii]